MSFAELIISIFPLDRVTWYVLVVCGCEQLLFMVSMLSIESECYDFKL